MLVFHVNYKKKFKYLLCIVSFGAQYMFAVQFPVIMEDEPSKAKHVDFSRAPGPSSGSMPGYPLYHCIYCSKMMVHQRVRILHIYSI